MRLLIFSFVWIFSTLSVQAGYIDQLKLQYAGEIGVMSFGLGKKVTSNYSFDILYGYVPENIGGTEIETYAFKNQYRLGNFGIKKIEFIPYMGLAIYHVVGLRFQTSRFASYPRNYYRMSSIRGLFYLGLESKLGDKNSKNSFYFESGINDFWLINYLNNQDEVDPAEYVTLAIGWKRSLEFL